MEKTRLAFDSDETTEDGGTEVKSEAEGPEGGDPKGNPHDYIDDKKQKDGVPLDQNNPEHLSKEGEEPTYQESRLVGVVEHEGHSASIHATEAGHIVKGKGSAGYLSSEPIADREHAEQYAKEVLKAHAKLSEREILSKNTNLSEASNQKWDGVSPKEKRNMWDSLTRGATHKLSACMNKVDGHVDNPGAYCKSLADEVGYKPM